MTQIVIEGEPGDRWKITLDLPRSAADSVEVERFASQVRGGGGVVINQVFHVAGGATKADLELAVKAAVADAQKRR